MVMIKGQLSLLEQTKKCTICGKDHPIDYFIRNSSTCKSCKKRLNREYREKNKQLGIRVSKQLCSDCGRVKEASYFSVSKGNPGGLQYKCKLCQRSIKKNPSLKRDSLKYKRAKDQATPPWLTPEMKEAIKDYYTLRDALNGFGGVTYEVDHIYALQAQDSCGLNVPWNLQIITGKENKAKYNNDGLYGGEI